MTRQKDQRLKTCEAAEYLGYEPATLRSWRYRDPGGKNGLSPKYEQPHGPRGKALYWQSDLDNWKKKNNGKAKA